MTVGGAGGRRFLLGEVAADERRHPKHRQNLSREAERSHPLGLGDARNARGEAAFVKHLLAVSGADSVEELKAALIDPRSYSHPFEMNDAFTGTEALLACDIDYVAPNARKTVAVVFSTMEARTIAESLLPQKIGADVYVIAPSELVPTEWVKQATRHCRSWTVRNLRNQTIADPIETLSLVDELCVIANEKTPQSGFDLKLPDAVEDLLWLALDLPIEARYYDIGGSRRGNPEVCLEARGVPGRVTARMAERASFTRQLMEIRLDNDFSSSGLWNGHGQMLSYDLLDIPFPLVRRIAAAQRDFDETVNPSDTGTDAWWLRHRQEKIDIARALQAAIGSSVTIKIRHEDAWVPIDDVGTE